MKYSITILHLTALAGAIVAPDQQLFAQIPIEADQEEHSLWNKLPSLDDIADRLKKPFHKPEAVANPLDQAFAKVKQECKHSKEHGFGTTGFDFQRWIEHGLEEEELPFPPPMEDEAYPPFPPPPHAPPFPPPPS